jgi:Kef-type K+ transport system membrane component KefB
VTLARAFRKIAAFAVPALSYLAATTSLAHGQEAATSAPDPVVHAVLGMALVLVAAKLGGELAHRLGQPAVLGELLAGVVLGNLELFGVSWFSRLASDPGIDLLAQIGVLILMFEIGLECTLAQMRLVAWSAFRVAVLGVAAPFALGWLVAQWLLPSSDPRTQLLVAAALTATSVGISARVLKDLGRAHEPAARIILGAAVIDDVLGLVLLAVVTGLVTSSARGVTLAKSELAIIVAKALLFLVAALGAGAFLSRPLYTLASRLRTRDVLLALSLAWCFVLAWAADALGLAALVGAFAAGLVLEDVHYRDFVARGERGLEELLHPIAAFLVPVFFVLMGIRTDLRVFAHGDAAVLASALTLAAIVGKQACALGAHGAGVDRLLVGLGMVPRGEVGLIFANVGLTLQIAGRPVINRSTFAAIVVMVMITTLITPPLLRWRLSRRQVAADGLSR